MKNIEYKGVPRMKLSKLIIMCFISVLGFSGLANAGTTVPYITTLGKSDTTTENRAYAGLVWTLKERTSWIPDLTLGFRSLRVKSSDSVDGVDLSARIKLNGGVAFDSTRLDYVGGERDILGNIGFGYSNTNSSFLGTLAVQGPYLRVGSDYELTNKRFVPYLELLTLDKPNKVNRIPGSNTCPAGTIDNGTNCQRL